MNWYEKLGRAVAEECNLTENSPIEHQCGTVWIINKDNTTTAISGMLTESED